MCRHFTHYVRLCMNMHHVLINVIKSNARVYSLDEIESLYVCFVFRVTLDANLSQVVSQLQTSSRGIFYIVVK